MLQQGFMLLTPHCRQGRSPLPIPPQPMWPIVSSHLHNTRVKGRIRNDLGIYILSSFGDNIDTRHAGACIDVVHHRRSGQA